MKSASLAVRAVHVLRLCLGLLCLQLWFFWLLYTEVTNIPYNQTLQYNSCMTDIVVLTIICLS